MYRSKIKEKTLEDKRKIASLYRGFINSQLLMKPRYPSCVNLRCSLHGMQMQHLKHIRCFKVFVVHIWNTLSFKILFQLEECEMCINSQLLMKPRYPSCVNLRCSLHGVQMQHLMHFRCFKVFVVYIWNTLSFKILLQLEECEMRFYFKILLRSRARTKHSRRILRNLHLRSSSLPLMNQKILVLNRYNY